MEVGKEITYRIKSPVNICGPYMSTKYSKATVEKIEGERVLLVSRKNWLRCWLDLKHLDIKEETT